MGSPTNTISSRNLDNKIINGDFRIDQRFSGTPITNPTTTYVIDRWRHDRLSDGTVVDQINRGSFGAPEGLVNYFGLETTVPASVGPLQFSEWFQVVDASNISESGFGTPLAKSLGLSFWVRSNIVGLHSGSLRSGSRSYVFPYTISQANVWEYKAITVPGDTTGIWNLTNDALAGILLSFAHSSGSSYRTASPNQWNAGIFLGATGGVNVTSIAGGTFHLTGVNLSIGGAPKPFKVRSFDEEMVHCQRYYRKYPHLPCIATSTQTVAIYAALIPEMRAAPLMFQTGVLNAQNGISNASQTAPSINTTFNSKNYTIGTAGNFPLNSFVTREALFIGVPANNGQFVYFDAEF